LDINSNMINPEKVIPQEAPALEVRSFAEEDIVVINKPLEAIRSGEILIHAAAAPINPLDLLRIHGKAGNILPFTPGTECSGVVVDAKGMHAQDLIGKKVTAFSMQGCFREYVIANSTEAIMLSDDADLEQASCGYVSPVTALGLVEIAEDHDAKVVINTAAYSTIGKNILKVCEEKGINLIGIVRGEENTLALKNLGAQNVLDQNDSDFEMKLQETINDLKPTVAFDCIGGHMSGLLLKCLPKYSMLVNYGSLGSKTLEGIDATDLRMRMKIVRGFTFYDWIREQHEIDRNKMYKYISENLNTLFKTNIAARVDLINFKDGLKLFNAKKICWKSHRQFE